MKRDIRLYHSRYDPQREAGRYLDSALGGKKPSLAVLIGPGLNYLGLELHKRLPSCRCVVLQPDAAFDGLLQREADCYWSPASPQGPEKLLRAALMDGWAAGGVCVLEWEPVTRELLAQSSALKTMVAAELAREAAAAATGAHWSARWLRNALRFSLSRSGRSDVLPGAGPVVVACAGPSLEASIPALREHREALSLWALSSAHATLAAHGLSPDAIISSDPGFWASLHLRPFDAGAATGPTLLLTPTAAVPASVLDHGPIAPFSSGSALEDITLAATGDRSLGLAPSGTASGSALRLALASGAQSVYACGLDLAAHGAREHASAYAFSALDDENARRLNPAYGAACARVIERYPDTLDGWRLSRAFGTYAKELSGLFDGSGNLARVEPSPLALGGAKLLARDLGAALSRGAGAQPPRFVPRGGHASQEAAPAIVRSVLERASRALNQAAQAKKPVRPDEASLVFSLGGRQLAVAVACAARGELTSAILKSALETMGSHARALERMWHDPK